MTYPFLFLLCSLACFRLSRLISEDKIFSELRALLIRKVPAPAKKKTREGITCPFCVSAYFSAAITIYIWLYLQAIPGMDAPLWCFGMWGGSVIWNQVFVRLSR